MGFALGPRMLRRAPRGWLPARAFPLRHSVYSHDYEPDGVPAIEATMGMTVTWRVELTDRAPYELAEERSVPAWLDSGPLLAHGNRWYKVRVRPQFGLMPRVGVPCFARLSRAVHVTVAVVLRSDVDDMSLYEASLLPFGLPLRAAVACPRLLLCLHAARGASMC